MDHSLLFVIKLNTIKSLFTTRTYIGLLLTDQLSSGGRSKLVGGGGLNSADFHKHYIIVNSFYSSFQNSLFISIFAYT